MNMKTKTLMLIAALTLVAAGCATTTPGVKLAGNGSLNAVVQPTAPANGYEGFARSSGRDR
jgi:hypothetical protein